MEGDKSNELCSKSSDDTSCKCVEGRCDICQNCSGFAPSDEELINDYLKAKLDGKLIPVGPVNEVDFYANTPENLTKPGAFPSIRNRSTEMNEWYFLTPMQNRSYRVSRHKENTYWRLDSGDKSITDSTGAPIGVKRALTYCTGKYPNGVSTGCYADEYRILCRREWVLHRLYYKGKKTMTPSAEGKRKKVGNEKTMTPSAEGKRKKVGNEKPAD